MLLTFQNSRLSSSCLLLAVLCYYYSRKVVTGTRDKRCYYVIALKFPCFTTKWKLPQNLNLLYLVIQIPSQLHQKEIQVSRGDREENPNSTTGRLIPTNSLTNWEPRGRECTDSGILMKMREFPLYQQRKFPYSFET